MCLSIGRLRIKNNVIAAPMAGISDKPFRSLCYTFGAGMVVSEMLSSNPDIWRKDQTLLRIDHTNDEGIKAVQIVGANATEMAITAKYCTEQGAQLIDINMGCPAKKINQTSAGSALLRYPELVSQILTSVVKAVDVPVTLKMRTGWDKEHKNYLVIAKIAEQSGISAITLHGRTRACLFTGEAEYDSIKAIKKAIRIPVIANGDIDSPQKAKQVLTYTGADAIMIGRAALGKPWIFSEIHHFFKTGELLPSKSLTEVKSLVIEHVKALHHFYGEYKGLRIARKHVSWYIQEYDNHHQFRRLFNAIEDSRHQLEALEAFFNNTHN